MQAYPLPPGKSWARIARPLVVVPLTFVGPQPDRITVTVSPPDPAPEPKAWEARLLALADLADAHERSIGGAGLVLTENRAERGRHVLVLASLPAAGWEERRARTAEFLRAAALGLTFTVELTEY